MALDDGLGREGAVKDVGALLDWIATQPGLDATRRCGPFWSASRRCAKRIRSSRRC
jgi:hypothetical protein